MVDRRLLNAVVQQVAAVGEFQMARFRSLPPGGGTEKQAREFVSEVDLHAEELLLAGLGKLVPEAGFFGEETGIQGGSHLRWIVDPLDGTINFLSGLEQFSISVALEANGRIELGVVLRPASRECYSALRGGGLLRNGAVCPEVPPGALASALIGNRDETERHPVGLHLNA